MAVAPRRVITDELLEISVRIKREAGVGHAQIQAVIDKFASQQHWHDRTGGIGFPLVEDVPQDRRGEFMAALAELAPQPDRAGASAAAPRNLSAAHIWPSRVL
jgi:hypothetical protein